MKIIHLGYTVFLTKNSHIIAMHTDDDQMYVLKGHRPKKFIEKYAGNYIKTVDSF